MKKRFFALLMTVLMLLGMLTACGGNQQTQPTANADEKTTVTLAHNMNKAMTKVLDAYIAKFTETFPDVEVVTVSSDEVTEDNLPNVLYCYPEEVAAYVEQGALVALDAHIDSKSLVLRADGTAEIVGLSDGQKKDILEVCYNEGSQFGDGAMYTLPLGRSSLVIYYNQTFFEENGLDAPLSWDTVAALCEQIKALNPDCIPLCIDDEAGLFASLCAQYGGEYTGAEGERYLFDNETNHAFVKTFNEWYQKGYVTTKTLAGREKTGSLVAQEGPKHYMVIGSTADAGNLRPEEESESYAFEISALPMPQVSYETAKVLVRGPGLCVFKCDDDVQITASWMLVKYLATNVEFLSAFAMASGYFPVRMEVLSEENYSAYLDSADGGANVAALAALACMEQQHTFFAETPFAAAGTAREQVAALLNKCLALTGDDVDAQIAAAFSEAVEACKKG